MQRRDFLGVLGSAAAWPLVARAQQPEQPARIGYIGLGSAAQNVWETDALLAGLRDLGYVEGRTARIEARFAEGDEGRLPGLAAELVGLNVDIIVTVASGVPAARRVTSTIPIVQAVGADLVASGIAASLAHPGGNVTGLTFFFAELMAKRLELLKQIVPSTAQVGVLMVGDNKPGNRDVLEVMEVTAKALSMVLQPIEVRGPTEFESAFAAWSDKELDGLVISDNGILLANRDAITALAARHRLPAIGAIELAVSGGLMAYGVNFPEMFRRAAVFVDKILKGVKPGDIPIEQATKFKLVLNLKTAKALGLDIPPILLARADEVIE